MSTCNRTEIAVTAANRASAELLVGRLLAGAEVEAGDAEGWSVYQGDEVVRHLSRVAAGLESAVLGDEQILGQLRAAVAGSRQAGVLGPELSKAAAVAIAAGREARRVTDVSWGGAGVGSAVVSTVRERAGTPIRTLVIGTGVAAGAIARGLVRAGLGQVTITGRTAGRATALAERLALLAAPWNDLEAQLAASDVVVIAVSAPAPILDRPMLDRVMGKRPSGARRLVIVDVGVQPAVAPLAPGSRAELVTLGQLSQGDAETVARRQAAVPAAAAVVEEAVAEWCRWDRARPLEDALRVLYIEARRTVGVIGDSLAAAGVDRDRVDAERIVESALKKLLHAHVTRLRDVAPSPHHGRL